ncbi:MAG: hypothetical protein IT416_02250 [Candidatus Pacebacteria bacterium]|nr:hypothetical protein [Candidatus Paceibacterota bacterium]
MPGSEQGLRAAAEKLAGVMKEKGLSAQYESLMALVDRVEDLDDPGMIVCLSNFFLREELIPLKEDKTIESDLAVLLSIIAAMMKEFVIHPDEQIIKE